MDPYIFGFFVLAYIAIFIWGLAKHKKTASAILFLVVAALIYDNAILALGHIIGEGNLLKKLSYGRFWLHAIFTPTLILFSLLVMREANIQFAYKKWVALSFGALWIVAMIVEYFLELSDFVLAPEESYGVLSYSMTEAASGPPPMILIVLIALLIAAIVLAWKRKWWWMLVGTIVMTIGSAFPIDIGSDAITNAFELFLIASLMWTAIHFSNETTYKRF